MSTLKIKMLTSQSGIDHDTGKNFSRLPGKEYDVPEAEAVRLVQREKAIPVDSKEYEVARKRVEAADAKALEENKNKATTKLAEARKASEAADIAAEEAKGAAAKAEADYKDAATEASNAAKLVVSLQKVVDAEKELKKANEEAGTDGDPDPEDNGKALSAMNKTELKAEIAALEGISDEDTEAAYKLTNAKMVEFIEAYEPPTPEDDSGEE